eukprot:1159761-Pelagomonas_calceolata.AAC.13
MLPAMLCICVPSGTGEPWMEHSLALLHKAWPGACVGYGGKSRQGEKDLHGRKEGSRSQALQDPARTAADEEWLLPLQGPTSTSKTTETKTGRNGAQHFSDDALPFPAEKRRP